MSDTTVLLGVVAAVVLFVMYRRLRLTNTELGRSESARVAAEAQIETRARALAEN
jgi:hypothetical protein